MAALSRTEDQVKAALRAVIEADATIAEKAEMLMEIAMGLQQKPQSGADLEAAVRLYETALGLLHDRPALLAARIRARLGTALMAIPGGGTEPVDRARAAFESALTTLRAEGLPEETAEAEMNLGLALQSLAGSGKARIHDAISAYQRALRTFDKGCHPKDFAILQNNLATAYLSVPFSDEKAKLREALAVQAFEEALAVVNLVDHPSEYAMLQNNLGNALQYVGSSHRLQNGFRALEAYDEALKVRNARATPAEYANTIANKANCLLNLPDDPAAPEAGNAANCAAAGALLREAQQIFDRLGEVEKAAMVAQAVMDLEGENPLAARQANGAN